MSYQVIARKWRPQTFEEVTGQEAITHTLLNAVEHDRLHHAYLFSGARGVGKTTTARLLAKALNCHSSDKPVAKSCNNCPSCQEIAEGRSIDVLEFDAASNTQVDKIRDLIIENINIAPARDRYKIFIIDEVHMLSTSSFNALLKTLEEPPPKVVFVMATTELHKVPDTILSRCQEFEFRTIPTAKIFERLNLIADAEGVKVTAEALREIARSGEGSMRDAQSNFDQVISFSSENIVIEDVINALGIASSEILTKTIEAIAHRKPQESLLVVEELIRRGQDLRNYCRDLLAFIRDLLVAKVTNHAEGLLDSAILDQEALRKYAEHFSESDLVRLFNSLAETETQLRAATQPRYILEIGLVKLMEMQRVTAIEKILERLAKLESGSPIEEKKTLIEESQSSEFEVQGSKFEVQGSKFEVQGSKFEVQGSKVGVQNSELKIERPISDFKPQIPNPVVNIAPEDTPFPVKNRESKDDDKTSNTQIIKESEPEEEKPKAEDQKPHVNFYDNLPMRMPEISPEILEHIEDSKLDAAFEERLLREGDNLKAIKTASQIIAQLSVANTITPAVSTNRALTNGAATAPAKSTFKLDLPDYSNESQEIPTLPDNPTEEDLLKYAENHPKIKMALRIFRGKVIGVTKT